MVIKAALQEEPLAVEVVQEAGRYPAIAQAIRQPQLALPATLVVGRFFRYGTTFQGNAGGERRW